jgi:hypothetical protein
MTYISKAKREATSWLTRRNLVERVREVTGNDEGKIYEQIGEAIEDRELPVVWGDWLESFWKMGGSGLPIQIGDKPPRNSQFWRQGAFDPDNPRKGQFDPNDPDRVFVGWDFDLDNPDVSEPEPRFRKPMFWRDRAEDFWPLPAATAHDEKKAIAFLAKYLESDANLLFDNARSMCLEKFRRLSKRGFRERVWRDARLAAGLSAKGKAGRRKASP